jgi:N-acyl-L-homoserine lactone synthetase
MINAITRSKIVESNMAMRAMFAARKQVFVDLLKWDLPVLEGQFEIDQFDTPDARYLILVGADGQHRASARLLPTAGPHILADLYPHLCEGVVPRGPRILEISRFCLDRNQDAASRLSARNQLVTALVDHAIHERIDCYTGVAELGWLAQILRFGWQCEPLGEPHGNTGSKIGALRIRIDDQTRARLERTGIYTPLSLQLVESRESVA